MKKLRLVGAILAALALLLLLLAGGSYNRLVRLRETVEQQWAQVQNVYQRRTDLVPALVATVAGAANFEKSTLAEITDARASVGRVMVDAKNLPADAAKLAEFQRAQDGLSTALSRLLVVVERYPDLKASAGFRDLQSQLEGTENRIAVERGRFNETAQNYNVAVKSFPTLLYAGLLGFQQKPYFSATPDAGKPPKVEFDFTKPATPKP